MDKQAIRDFLEKKIEAVWEKYKKMRSLEGLQKWLEGDARQTREELFTKMEKKLYTLQLIFFLVGSEKKDKFNESLLAALRETIPSALELIQSEIMDCQDELIELEGIIREEFWETEEEKQRMLSHRQDQKKELEYWKEIKEYLNNFF